MNRRALLTGAVLPVVGAGCLKFDRFPWEEPDIKDTERDDLPEDMRGQGQAEPLTISAERSPEELETISFSGETLCCFEAGSAALNHVESQLDTSIESTRVEVSGKDCSHGAMIMMYVVFSFEEGKLLTKPNVDFEDVVEATPDSVRMSLSIDGEIYDCEEEITVVQRRVMSREPIV
ncbi:hypothetical protein [Natronorubrum sp. DTA28]|uniref:hypothetical protein n=1 Tax=Natronorubrum sp. DTA28 TaxID=3447019 RepID=UPI003F847491